jgi:hypothetical protein
MTGPRAFSSTAFLLAALLVPATAFAQGNVRVQQIDGKVEQYHGVGLRLRGDMLRIISPDHVGTLVMRRAACSWIGGLERCLPLTLELSQRGSHQISFKRGTIYFNLSSAPHTLPHSSRVVEPRGIVGQLETIHGTFISVTGRLDEVTP